MRQLHCILELQICSFGSYSHCTYTTFNIVKIFCFVAVHVCISPSNSSSHNIHARRNSGLDPAKEQPRSRELNANATQCYTIISSCYSLQISTPSMRQIRSTVIIPRSAMHANVPPRPWTPNYKIKGCAMWGIFSFLKFRFIIRVLFNRLTLLR